MEYRWFKNGRMVVKSVDIERISIYGLTQEYFDDHIGNRKHYEGYLALYETNITSLGKLETVGGYLDLESTKIASLGNLKSVGDGLDLNDCSNLTSLGKLEYVRGDLDLSKTNITDLGKLETVGGDIHCTEGSTTHKLLMNSKFADQVINF